MFISPEVVPRTSPDNLFSRRRSQGPAPIKKQSGMVPRTRPDIILRRPRSPCQGPMMSSGEAGGRNIDVANLCQSGRAGRMAASNNQGWPAANRISKGSPGLHGHGHSCSGSSHSSRSNAQSKPFAAISCPMHTSLGQRG